MPSPVRILLAGRKSVTAQALEWLVARQDVRIVGVLTDTHLDVSPTRDMAVKLGVPLVDFRNVEGMIDSGELTYDLLLSVLYWRKIKPSLLDHPARGAINFHPAILPEYKGCGGYNLAILEAREDWGVSAHYMDAEIDTGGIIEVDRFPIDAQSATVIDLERESRAALFEQIKRVVSAALQSEDMLLTTPNEGGRYVSRAEMEAMKRIAPGDDIARKIRAFWFPPYDGATIEIDGQAFTLVDQSILRLLADPDASSLFTGAAPG